MSEVPSKAPSMVAPRPQARNGSTRTLSGLWSPRPDPLIWLQNWENSGWTLVCLKPPPSDTVDGSEILRSPVDMINIPVIYRVSKTSQVVVWDFWTINRMAAKRYGSAISWGGILSLLEFPMRLLKKWENSGWTLVFEAPFLFWTSWFRGLFLVSFPFPTTLLFKQFCDRHTVHQNFEKDINSYLQQKSTVKLFHPFFVAEIFERNPWTLLKSDMWTFSGGDFWKNY